MYYLRKSNISVLLNEFYVTFSNNILMTKDFSK